MPPSYLPRISVVIPSYGQMDYLRSTLASFIAVSPWASLIVVDDASPDWDSSVTDVAAAIQGCIVQRFETRGGLTRGWNFGIDAALKLGLCDYIVMGNSDILVCDGWWKGLIGALNAGHPFVGPLTNAPGATKNNRQNIVNYLKDYRASDNQRHIDNTSRQLRREFSDDIAMPCDINGFFIMGRVDSFRRFAYSADSFFPSKIYKMPSGRDNPDPANCGQEDWLNARVKAAGMQNAAALSSFCFHYRSCSRGVKHVTAGAYRKDVGLIRQKKHGTARRLHGH